MTSAREKCFSVILKKKRACILWIGAGLSKEAGLPDAYELSEYIAEHIKNTPASIDRKDLSRIAQLYIEKQTELHNEKFARDSLVRLLRYKFDQKLDLSNSHKLIRKLIKSRYFDTIITTNYDRLLEETIGKCKVVIRNEDLRDVEEKQVVLIKLHGDIKGDSGDLIITRSDYDDFLPRKEIILIKITALLAEKNLICLGYSMNDENFRMSYQKIKEQLGPFKNELFIVTPDPPQFPLEKNEFWVQEEASKFLNELYKRIFKRKILRSYSIIGSSVSVFILFIWFLLPKIVSEKNELSWLQSQMEPLRQLRDLGSKGELIKSYARINRSYIYDDALAIIAFTMVKKFDNAKRIITALSFLERENKLDLRGGLFPVYSIDMNNKPLSSEIPTGSLAWVGYSLNFYSLTKKDTTFLPFTRNIANFLMAQRVQFEKDGKILELINRVYNDSHFASDSCARSDTKDNLIFYFFLVSMAHVLRDQTSAADYYLTEAEKIKQSILQAFTNKIHREEFNLGIVYNELNTSKGNVDITDSTIISEFFLDNFFLGSLFWLSLDSVNYAENLLNSAEQYLAIRNQNSQPIGFLPYSRPDHESYIWCGGTLKIAFAYQRLATYYKMKDERKFREYHKAAENLISSMREWRNPLTGGLKYATKDMPSFLMKVGKCEFLEGGFITDESAESTAWMVINEFFADDCFLFKTQ